MFDMPFILHSPLATLGLLTLLVPLGIHLLSKAKPRVVAFSHIAFIKVTSSPVLRQLRLTQLILLGLRMLMLLLATLILAQLYWQNANPRINSHILLTEDWLNYATDDEKQRLVGQANDSTLVILSTTNRSINKTELAQWQSNNLKTPALNLWSKVSTYAANQPDDSTISVYTTNRLKQFVGAKTPLPEQLEWHVKTIPVDRLTQKFSANVKVIYDDENESLLGYLGGAFDAISSHEELNLNIDYVRSNHLKSDSEHLQENDKIIRLGEQSPGLEQQHLVVAQGHYITQAELQNIKQPDFVLTLTQLLFSEQSQAWWLDNTRVSAQQITQHSPLGDTPKTLRQVQDTAIQSANLTPLHILLILCLAVIFMLERLLSEWPNRRLKTELDE